MSSLLSNNVGRVEDIKKVRYSNKVMKRIFAKQILNRENKDKLMTENNELLKRMTMQHPVTVDGELMGTSIHTDDSLSKLVRRDGSPIKTSSLR